MWKKYAKNRHYLWKNKSDLWIVAEKDVDNFAMNSPHLIPKFASVPNPAAVVVLPNLRITVLTDRLLRLEYDPSQTYEDRPSQVFWYRQQPTPNYTTRHDHPGTSAEPGETRCFELETDFLRLVYQMGNPPDGSWGGSLSILLKGTDIHWNPGLSPKGALPGTYRTLDTVDGHIPVEKGLLSRDGWSVVDDSQSLVFDETGWLSLRGAAPGTKDLYFFGYGTDYQDLLRDYRAIAGPVPMIPRFILGNWWSRYWEYSQDDITNLIKEFQSNQVPLSVFIIDMDWHITRTGNQSSGWTGYTWNKTLFPNHKALLKFIHSQGLHTALNLHPAEGIHAHENQYETFATRMGHAPSSGEPIPFDLADPQFARNYFELLHHPHEEDGVDFWWIDWQQGVLSRLPGLDPLWWLNHLHFYDLGRTGSKRPFVFSRWGGLGNHRYPIGFSGDTVVSWESLAFQPYFTAAAANVGYSWWSHDIGGHWSGIEEPELYLRWVQYGLFSPILRLHSTKNPIHERRPYAFDAEISRLARHTMQLRHAFIPYLYSMAWRDHHDALPLIRPLYHQFPNHEQAYEYTNIYTFGTELLAAPFTSPLDHDTRLARQTIWLPPGDWFDFFSGKYYPSGHHVLYGGLEDIPLFARAGAIVPLAPLSAWGGVDNPDHLRLHIFPGADNKFELYEDDGNTTAYQKGGYALTPFSLKSDISALTFTIEPVQGDLKCCPSVRTYELKFRGVQLPDQVLLRRNGVKHHTSTEYDPETGTLTVPIPFKVKPTDTIIISLARTDSPIIRRHEHLLPTCAAMLSRFRLESSMKAEMMKHLAELLEDPYLLARYRPSLREPHLRALLETITRSGVSLAVETGCRRIQLWNDNPEHSLKPVTYRLTVNQHQSPRRLPERNYIEAGAVPGFKVIDVDETFVKHPWLLEVNYFGVLTIRMSHQD